MSEEATTAAKAIEMGIAITFSPQKSSHPSHSSLSRRGHTDLQEDSSSSWGHAQDMALVQQAMFLPRLFVSFSAQDPAAR